MNLWGRKYKNKHWDCFLFQEHRNIRLRLRNDGNEDPPETYQPEQNRYLKHNSDIISLPTYVALGVLFIGLLLFGLAYVLHYRLPAPLSIKDIRSHPNQFIAERALSHLRQLTSYGSKPVGSYENEVLAVEFLSREISFIMQRANPAQKISFDIQKCSGSYFLEFKPHGITNYYSQVQNVVVKLFSNTNSSSSLLINCHFDSVPSSPGSPLYFCLHCMREQCLKKFGHTVTKAPYTYLFLFWSDILLCKNSFNIFSCWNSIKVSIALALC